MNLRISLQITQLNVQNLNFIWIFYYIILNIWHMFNNILNLTPPTQHLRNEVQ